MEICNQWPTLSLLMVGTGVAVWGGIIVMFLVSMFEKEPESSESVLEKAERIRKEQEKILLFSGTGQDQHFQFTLMLSLFV